MSRPLRIELIRSGGFANLRLQRTLDAEGLPVAEAEELRPLVDEIDFAATGERPAGQADRFQYDLTVTDAGATRRATFGEPLPPEPRALIERVLATTGGQRP